MGEREREGKREVKEDREKMHWEMFQLVSSDNIYMDFPNKM